MQNALQNLVMAASRKPSNGSWQQGAAIDTVANKNDAYLLSLRKIENAAISQKLREEIEAYKAQIAVAQGVGCQLYKA